MKEALQILSFETQRCMHVIQFSIQTVLYIAFETAESNIKISEMSFKVKYTEFNKTLGSQNCD